MVGYICLDNKNAKYNEYGSNHASSNNQKRLIRHNDTPFPGLFLLVASALP